MSYEHSFSQTAQQIFEKRYYLRDATNALLETSPEQLFQRVAHTVAAVELESTREKTESIFYQLMLTKDFLPNSPTLMNAGNEGTLSACFVLPLEDTMVGIMDCAKNAALVQKYGGGTGFSLSRIRPKGASIRTTHGKACGPIAVLQHLSSVSKLVTQGGKRDGANMAVLSVHHPDILEFIDCKLKEGDIHNFNISVGATNEFMTAVLNNTEYNLYDYETGTIVGRQNARLVWDRIIQNAYCNGEPGMVWLDEMNKSNPVRQIGSIEATNPCVSGDTLVMIAGDSPKPIKDLVGKEFPVYCVNNRGALVVRKAYNVRQTRQNQKLYKVLLDDETFVEATEDHQFILSNNKKIYLKDLKPGDSLMRFDRQVDTWHGVNYWRVSNGNLGKFEHRYLDEFYFGRKRAEGEVVHHKVLSLNHKVVSIEFSRIADVYDLTVEEFLNYAIVTSNSTEKQSGLIIWDCGEQPLLPFESCNLGSINVANFYDVLTNDIDWDRLLFAVEYAIRFLDNVIDVNKYAIEEIEQATKLTRKIGLGIMGFADLLIKLNIPYNSNEGVEFASKLMKFIRTAADNYSLVLGEEKGVFPAWNNSIYALMTDRPQYRNACRLSIAPTGTLAMLADCSYGIEPLFALVFEKKNILEGKSFHFVNSAFEKAAKQEHFYTAELIESLSYGHSLQDYNDIPQTIKRLFVTTFDIEPEWHVKMQAAFQQHIDAGVSKTINLSADASFAVVDQVYRLAYELGCKGITVYRANSREKEVLSVGIDIKTEKTTEDRPDLLFGTTERLRTGHGNIYVTITHNDEGKPFEVFAALGKAGECNSAYLEAISRLLSVALRSNISIDELTNHLRGITCHPRWDNGNTIFSPVDAVAKALERYKNGQRLEIQNNSSTQQLSHSKIELSQQCPECGGVLLYTESCLHCSSCDYSKC